jgi:hypothetical protein
VLRVVALEVAVMRGVEEGDDRHHLRQAEARRTVTPSGLKQSPFPARFKELTKIVYVTEKR